MVILQISKIFFLRACIKEYDVLTVLILGPILDHVFGPKKDKLFCPVFLFCRGMSNAICDLLLYLQSVGLNNSWIYPGTIPFQYLKMVFAIQYSTLSDVFYSTLSKVQWIDMRSLELNLDKNERLAFIFLWLLKPSLLHLI